MYACVYYVHPEIVSDSMLAFDLETTGLNPEKDFITCAAVYDPCSETKRVFFFTNRTTDDKAEMFMCLLDNADRLCSFNGAAFDIPFLARQFSLSMDRVASWRLKLNDVYVACRWGLGVTFSLQTLLECNGLQGKTGSGEDAVRFFTEERWEELGAYCLHDTCMTYDVSSCCAIVIPKCPGLTLDLVDGRFHMNRSHVGMEEVPPSMTSFAFATFEEMLKTYQDDCLLARGDLAEFYGIPTGSGSELPLQERLTDPCNDGELSFFYVATMGSTEPLDFKHYAPSCSELLMLCPCDIYFLCNFEANFRQARTGTWKTLNDQQRTLFWKYVRFKLRTAQQGVKLGNYTGIIPQEPGLQRAMRTPHTINMTNYLRADTPTALNMLKSYSPLWIPFAFRKKHGLFI